MSNINRIHSSAKKDRTQVPRPQETLSHNTTSGDSAVANEISQNDIRFLRDVPVLGQDAGANFVMSDGPMASKDVNYVFPLAEKELRAFVHAVDQLFGTEQARRSALDWIHEMEVMNWPVGEAIPDWRQATIRASAQLCSSHSVNLRQNATQIGATE